MKQMEGERGAGVVGEWPELQFLPAAMAAARRGRAQQPGGARIRVFGGERERGSRGLSRWCRGNESVPISLGFRGVHFGHGRTRGREKRKKERGREAGSGWCWAGPGPARVGWLGLAGRFLFFFLQQKIFPFFFFCFQNCK